MLCTMETPLDNYKFSYVKHVNNTYFEDIFFSLYFRECRAEINPYKLSNETNGLTVIIDENGFKNKYVTNACIYEPAYLNNI